MLSWLRRWFSGGHAGVPGRVDASRSASVLAEPGRSPSVPTEPESGPEAPPAPSDHEEREEEPFGDEPVPLPLDGRLDLHPFHPRDVKPLLEEYLSECRKHGVLLVEVVHGKGTGALRRTVQSVLSKLPEVESFSTADEGRGGWGVTLVRLKPPG